MTIRKLSNEQVDQICELYRTGNMSQRKLAAKFRVSQVTIGRIVKGIKKTTQTTEERFWSKVDTSGGNDVCWTWTGSRSTNGYGTFKLSTNKTVLTHRYAYRLATGKQIPRGMHVCHACDNPSCCNPKHLSVGTPKQNVEDSIRRGRKYMGGSRPKLNEIITCELKFLHDLG